MRSSAQDTNVGIQASAPKFSWALILAVAAIQTAILGYMIWDRASLLRTGREIVLDVTPVDPRSLFRGDYVILGYGNLSRIDLKPLNAEKSTKGAAAYVTLRKDAGANWQPVALSADYPQDVGEDGVVLRGSIERSGQSSAMVRYGIEAYFVPEGTGRKIERMIGEKKIQVVVAVDKGGRAAIKALIADGQRIYNEPLL